jgi:hypothetical protein
VSDADMLESRAMLPKAGDVIGEPCDVSSSEEDKVEGWRRRRRFAIGARGRGRVGRRSRANWMGWVRSGGGGGRRRGVENAVNEVDPERGATSRVVFLEIQSAWSLDT